MKNEPIALSHALQSGGEGDEERRANKKGKENQGAQLGSNENPMLPWLRQDCPEPAVEGTGVYIFWDSEWTKWTHFLSSVP